MSQQMFFELESLAGPDPAPRDAPERGSEAPPPAPAASSSWRQRQALQRAVLRWLEQTDSPTGAALNVVTRIANIRADVAAFWSVPVRNRHEEGPTQILHPVRTAIVQCHMEREECWPDCIRSQGILPQLRALKQELAQEEAQIREHEPQLRATDTLFEEYSEWCYAESTNRAYHRAKRAIEKLEHALYHGTRFEQIRSAQLTDRLYLAVPNGVVTKEELADGWGLLWVDDDLSVSVAGEPTEKECLPSNRLHLVQNIAAAGKRASLFASGVCRSSQGAAKFVKPPRGHRQAQELRLSEL